MSNGGTTPGPIPEPGVRRIVVRSETVNGRLSLSVDPWSAPVSRRAGTIFFTLEGDPGQRMELVPKGENGEAGGWDRWDRMLDRPDAAPPGGPLVVKVKAGAPKRAWCEYSIVIHTPNHGTVEIDPEIFICD
jgi:hypothetical protein